LLGNEITQDFLGKLRNDGLLATLFDDLADVRFYVKNHHGEYVMANPAFAAFCGAEAEATILGQTDFDVFALELAKQLASDDRHVLDGTIVKNRIDLVFLPQGGIRWDLSNKIPLYGRKGRIIGVAAVIRDWRRQNSDNTVFNDMAKALEIVECRYSEVLVVPELATAAGLSVSQFGRNFKKFFHMSPLQFINAVRINAARRMLAGSTVSIAEIAARAGFHDHSYFTRQFTRSMDMSPKAYRKQFCD
jgi:AraC-like DNA-binding protein